MVYWHPERRLKEEGTLSTVFLSLAQLAIAIVLSAIAAYLAFYLFQWFTRGLDEWEELRRGNAAVGVVLGAVVVAVAVVLRPALTVTTTTWDVGSDTVSRTLLVEAIQLAIGLILALITIVLALYLFAALTRGLDEIKEIRDGNLAVAGLLAGIVLGVSLMVSQSVAQILALVSSILY